METRIVATILSFCDDSIAERDALVLTHRLTRAAFLFGGSFIERINMKVPYSLHVLWLMDKKFKCIQTRTISIGASSLFEHLARYLKQLNHSNSLKQGAMGCVHARIAVHKDPRHLKQWKQLNEPTLARTSIGPMRKKQKVKATFESLPSECWLTIFSYLEDSPKDACVFFGVSRFHRSIILSHPFKPLYMYEYNQACMGVPALLRMHTHYFKLLAHQYTCHDIENHRGEQIQTYLKLLNSKRTPRADLKKIDYNLLYECSFDVFKHDESSSRVLAGRNTFKDPERTTIMNLHSAYSGKIRQLDVQNDLFTINVYYEMKNVINKLFPSTNLGVECIFHNLFFKFTLDYSECDFFLKRMSFQEPMEAVSSIFFYLRRTYLRHVHNHLRMIQPQYSYTNYVRLGRVSRFCMETLQKRKKSVFQCSIVTHITNDLASGIIMSATYKAGLVASHRVFNLMFQPVANKQFPWYGVNSVPADSLSFVGWDNKIWIKNWNPNVLQWVDTFEKNVVGILERSGELCGVCAACGRKLVSERQKIGTNCAQFIKKVLEENAEHIE